MKPERTKHNYTSEIELKSLLIRIKNKKDESLDYSQENNRKINKYILLFNKINNKKYANELIQKRNIVKYKIKDKIIELSETCTIDTESYENFGRIVLLMIKNILTKPNFSGYTYRDDFYSDAIHKILKYLHNFNHKMISERSGQLVNSFAYISQIIHNSVLFIINTKKKEQLNIKNRVSMEIVDHNLNVKDYDKISKSTLYLDELNEKTQEETVIYIEYIEDTLVDYIINLDLDGLSKTKLFYPHDYYISMDEYNELKPYLKNISIIKSTDDTI